MPYTYAHKEVDGTSSTLTLTTSHAYDRSGVSFVPSRVESHRDCDLKATERRIGTLRRARVVVG